MSEKMSLQEIIESVLDDKGVKYDIVNDSTVQYVVYGVHSID